LRRVSRQTKLTKALCLRDQARMAALFVDNPLLALTEALLSQKALFGAVAHAWVHACLHLAYGDSAAEPRSAALPQPHPGPLPFLVNARAYRGIFAHSQAIAAAPAAQARITAATCQGLTVSALFQKAPIQLVAMADFLSLPTMSARLQPSSGNALEVFWP
jgi:hypothetical protein